jgi:hemolysin activation/secretion protein
MKAIVLIFLLTAVLNSAYAQTAPIGQISRSQDILNAQDRFKIDSNAPRKFRLKSVVIEGFTLKNSKDLERMLATYRNKYVTEDEINAIIDQVKAYYAQAGYDDLIQYSHTLKKGKLLITATLINP